MFHLAGFSISFILGLLVAIWVYTDAQKRGDGNSVLWGIGTFLCCPIVPIIYLIVRK